MTQMEVSMEVVHLLLDKRDGDVTVEVLPISDWNQVIGMILLVLKVE